MEYVFVGLVVAAALGYVLWGVVKKMTAKTPGCACSGKSACGGCPMKKGSSGCH